MAQVYHAYEHVVKYYKNHDNKYKQILLYSIPLEQLLELEARLYYAGMKCKSCTKYISSSYYDVSKGCEGSLELSKTSEGAARWIHKKFE